MKLLHKCFDLYLSYSLHIGFEVWCMVQITYYYLHLKPDHNLAIVVFLGTVFGYNFLKYADGFISKRMPWHKFKWFFVLNALIFVIFCFFYSQLIFLLQIILIILVTMIFIYPKIRKITSLKLIYVSFCLSLVTVFLPLSQHTHLQSQVFLVFFERFVLIITLLIPFEIADLKNDIDIVTIPKIIGIHKTKLLGFLLLIIVFFINIMSNDIDFIKFFIYILIFLSILFSNTIKSKYFTRFWVESIPIIWYLMLYFL